MAKKLKTAKPIKATQTKPPALEKIPVVTKDITAKHFIEKLKSYQSDAELKKIQRYFKSGEGDYGEGDVFIGVRMGQVFELAKAFSAMPVSELAKLMDSPIHEARAGAMSIMDKESRNKKITEARLKEIFDLFIKKIDRVNNWDLVDLGTLYMTGRYLFDKPRKILYKMARSKNIWERRTAIISTTYFIRQGDIDDTMAIAEILVNDKEDLVHKATGWMLRFACGKDQKRVLAFLDKYAATMPRTLLRYTIENLSKKQKDHYMNLKM